MPDILDSSLNILKNTKRRQRLISSAALLLSLLVAVDVCWVLRRPALTQAGDATCGIVEHSHREDCWETRCVCTLPEEAHIHEDGCYTVVETENGEEKQLICQLSTEPHQHTESCCDTVLVCTVPEHVHSITCYADKTADVETQLDWQEMFAGYPYTGVLRQDLVGIAQTQVGYQESEWNFEVGDDGIRRGYTRYGAWYGAPYSDWTAMFVSFCLHYAGADPQLYPGNTGAGSMAAAWQSLGNYAPAGAYTPAAGDLVFFRDNTAGIVSAVQNTAFYVIRGDADNSVRRDLLQIADGTILGWGITEEPLLPEETEDTTTPTDAAEPTEPEISGPAVPVWDIPDISNGPAVFIFAGGSKKAALPGINVMSTGSVTDLVAYLQSHHGSYSFTLLDTNNQELPKDDKGNYIVTAETSYKLTLTVNNPEGFLPGTYQYQLPDGLRVNGGTGEFILTDGTNVGTWTVTDEGLITMVFNEEMNSRTDITISATMGVIFTERDEPLNFDGKITVTIEKPPQEDLVTQLNKWAYQGNPENGEKPDPTKLYWTIQIIGQADSHIPGSVITDQLIMGEHTYTESDIAGGLHFGVSERDPVTGQELNWHSWHVSPDDPNLVWTETGWTYTIPETVVCKYCGELELGNNGWIYGIDYSSTPTPTGVVGSLPYMNRVTVDGQQVEGWASFTHGETQADIIKHGSFHGDAEGGAFLWEFQATVPGIQPGQRATYFWYLSDSMHLRQEDAGTVGYVHNNANEARVTATNQGVTVEVPNIKYATDEDQFVWHNSWSSQNNGVYYGQEIQLLCRCNCTADTCVYWNGTACTTHIWFQGDDGNWYTNDFCQCWAVEGDTVFTFSYETDDLSLVEEYGGQNYYLRNQALLFNKVKQPDGSLESVEVAGTQVDVPIPGVFKKELTHDFDGYTAHYTITVNESKLVLTGGEPLVIHDEMTETLAFISGSLVITAEDAQGNRTTLKQDTDYTIAYDGTGDVTDDQGRPVHVLDIVIQHPQPVMYILDYDATLVIPPGTTQAVKYSNSATVTIWGKDMTDESDEKVYADINIAARKYQVEIQKLDAQTGEPLPGATFGLFNKQGGLITSGETDASGVLSFQTNIIQGIILREHMLYYIQELKAPPGYRLDDTRHWFTFCNHTGESCAQCDGLLAGYDGLRIPFEQIGNVPIVNEQMVYDLPATGGWGIYPIVWFSAACIVIPFIYGFLRRRKRERRGVG